MKTCAPRKSDKGKDASYSSLRSMKMNGAEWKREWAVWMEEQIQLVLLLLPLPLPLPLSPLLHVSLSPCSSILPYKTQVLIIVHHPPLFFFFFLVAFEVVASETCTFWRCRRGPSLSKVGSSVAPPNITVSTKMKDGVLG